MLILKRYKLLLVGLLVFTFQAPQSFGDIPSAKGENSIAIGSGFPGLVHLGINGFYEISSTFGIGAGASLYLFYQQQYIQFRFFNSKDLSLSLLAEQGDVGDVAHYQAMGLAFSKPLTEGKLDGSIVFSPHPEEPAGLSTGLKITRKSGFFYGVSLIRNYYPGIFFGKNLYVLKN